MSFAPIIFGSALLVLLCALGIGGAMRRLVRDARRLRGIERVAGGYCPACGYDQVGRISEACIECGYRFTDDELQRLRNIEPALPRVRRESQG